MLDRLDPQQIRFPAAILAVAAIAGIVVLTPERGGRRRGRSEAATCEQVAAPAPKDVAGLERPRCALDADKTYTATVETSCGTFAIELDSRRRPKTGGSFVTLARDGFYDGLGFHRIVPGFVIQGGDPNGDGTGGPGYKMRERAADDVVYSEGVVAMAKGGDEPAGTSGSQFFVVTGADTGLRPTTPCWARSCGHRRREASRGGESRHAAAGRPSGEPVVIEKVTITEGSSAGQ